MQNIVNYFNTFLDIIFDGALRVYPPSVIIQYWADINYTQGLENFIVYFLHHPEYFFSYFVWIWFAVFTFKLLLIYPFNWIRSIIRKCRLS